MTKQQFIKQQAVECIFEDMPYQMYRGYIMQAVKEPIKFTVSPARYNELAREVL